MCSLLSQLHYVFDRRHVNECERMFDLTKMEGNAKRAIAKMYKHLWHVLPDIIWMHRASEAEVKNRFVGFDRFQQYYSEHLKEKAVIFVSCHLGSWELCPQIISRFITPTSSIFKPHSKAWVNNFIANARTSYGQTSISKSQGLLPIFKKLKRGGSIGLVIDQNGGKEGVDSFFLGKKCKSWDSAIQLAEKTKCPIVPIAIVRRGREFVFLWEPEIDLIYMENQTLDLRSSVIKVDDALSNFVKSAPDQWMWLGRKWGRNFEEMMAA